MIRSKPRKPAPPSAAIVAEMLGPTTPLWDSLRSEMSRDHPPITEQWVYGGEKYGWALRLRHRQRSLLYLKPLERCFLVSLALGAKAVEVALASTLPKRIVRLIDEADEYPEGKAIRFEVHGARDVRVAVQLATIKLTSARPAARVRPTPRNAPR